MKLNNNKEKKNSHTLKAYDNKNFLHSKDSRILRILAEYMYPEQRFKTLGVKRTIIFFGSARIEPKDIIEKQIEKLQAKIDLSTKESDKMKLEFEVLNNKLFLSRFYDEAKDLSFKLTKWSLDLPTKEKIHITTGGGPGIMEAANRGSQEAGGQSIGLNISLPFEQKPNPYIHENLNFEFHYFFMRKFWLVYLSQVLIVFPGGFGTIDELMEVLTLRQTNKMKSPRLVILYNEEWWRKIINFGYLADMGMINHQDMKLFKFVNSPEEAFEYIIGELTKNKYTKNL